MTPEQIARARRILTEATPGLWHPWPEMLVAALDWAEIQHGIAVAQMKQCEKLEAQIEHLHKISGIEFRRIEAQAHEKYKTELIKLRAVAKAADKLSRGPKDSYEAETDIRQLRAALKAWQIMASFQAP